MQHSAMPVWVNLASLSTYFLFQRPQYEDMIKIMLQIPGCDMESLHQFEERFILNVDQNKPPSEKKKREAYKKLIAGVMGVSTVVWSIYIYLCVLFIFIFILGPYRGLSCDIISGQFCKSSVV